MKALLRKIKRILRDKRTRRLLTRIIGGFAAVIVFITTYALILPAITMEAEADCGIEAHQHDDSCYEEVLICTLPESGGHYHTKTCYNDDSVLVCGLEETEGHTHGSSCYEKVLICDKEVHTHSAACYRHDSESFMDAAVTADPAAGSTEATATAAASYEAAAEESSDSISAYNSGSAEDESSNPEAAGSYADSASETADDNFASSADASDTASNAASTSSDSSSSADGSLPRDSYVPTLDPLNFDTILTDRTGIYYYAPADGEVIENSAAITDWKKTDEDTELGRNDILRVYLAYTIPAGALNETNETARYRLPANLHLTDAQVNAINESENGIAGQYINYDTLEITDPDQYHKYLGAEAVEGTRTPSNDLAKYLEEHADQHDDQHDGQEYISAVVKVENVYNENGDYLGQDLIFTFTPYSVQKNRNEYDSAGQPTKAGRKISGWFTLDFNMEQVDWSEQTADIVFVPEGTDAQNNRIQEIHTGLTLVEENGAEMSGTENPDTIAENTAPEEESEKTEEETKDSPEEPQEELQEKADQPDTAATDQTAEAVEPAEAAATAADSSEKLSDEKKEVGSLEYKDGTLTSEGTGYKITLDYKADAQIPENAYLKVSEITRESDPEAYEACLKEAEKTIPTDNKTTVDDKASRFFDIEIFVDEQVNDRAADKTAEMDLQDHEEPVEESAEEEYTETVAGKTEPAEEENTETLAGETESAEEENTETVAGETESAEKGNTETLAEKTEPSEKESTETVARKIEPAAPVKVNIQLFDTEVSENVDKYDAEQYKVIHFAEEGTEEIQDVTAQTIDDHQKQDHSATSNTTANAPEIAPPTEVQFETESFSIYGVVYTVDFEAVSNVDGKTYSYSIRGGDGIGLSQLLPVLGVVKDDKDTAEVNEVKEFINQIENVDFSDSSLINVSKAEKDTTVGAIKELYGLKCENSADLTEDDIEEIDRKIITEGDWALISLKAFNSQERLTITMRDGAVFVINVTDANKTGVPVSGFFDNENGYILYTKINGVIYVMDTAGVPWRVDNPSDLDTMGVEYKWRFEFVYKDQSTNVNYYKVHPFNDDSKTIALNWTGQALVQTGTNQISIVPYGDGYIFEGYNNTRLANYDGWFAGARNGDYCQIMIYEQEHPETFNFTVTTADNEMGTVSGKSTTGRDVSGDSFESITNGSSSNNKTNKYPITAVPKNKYPNNPKYIFDHWELDGNPLDKNIYQQTINAGRLELQHNNSVLTAVFVENPAYDVHDIPDDDKEGTPINKEELQAWLNDLKSKQVPLNKEGCKKTAEVYDYENRIYRVDLTSQASLSTFEGTIDLGFIIDVSASMKFPSKLDAIDEMSNVDIRNINFGFWEWHNEKWMWKYGDNYYDPYKKYYIISDEQGTSTVYLIERRNNHWEYKDSSADDSTFKELNTGATFKAKDYDNYDNNYHYQVYEDGDNGKTRRQYLESSLDGTMRELREILGILSLASDSSKDPDVKVAWNTFKNYLPNGTGQLQHQFVTAKNGIDLEYESSTYGGGTSTDIALLDAAGVKRSDVTDYEDYYSTTKYSEWYPKPGVSTTFTYENDYNNGFQWENSATKYAVLITDGAPQRGGRNIDNKYVENAAQKLKDRGVTLITVGLGMDNVKNGKVLLYDIADVGKNGENLFYSAKSGDELQYVLLEIIKQIIKDATVQGDVTDTINDAFYPVNKETGKPLENGQMIDLEGNLTTDSSAPHGTIKRNNDGTYTVDWTNQAFTVDGWHGTVYVKAKEDLLGGNAITTNQGNAVIESKTYTLPGQTQPVALKNDPDSLKTKTVSLTSPSVNVNELNFTHNDNEWTVYLGTEVDPKAELIKMYDNILVEEVVTNASDNDHDSLPDKISSSGELRYPLVEAISDQREGFASGDPQTFFLKDLISKITNGSISDGSKLDWNALIAEANKGDQNKGITIPYDEYGINDNSNINIKLTKTVVSGETGIETSPHNTSVTGDAVERYTLTVLYSPDYTVLPVGQGGQSQIDFQTGQYGTKYAGHGAGTEDSINEHIINVFVKGLQITKKDENWINDLTGAEFKLYKVKNGVTTEVEGLVQNGAVFTIENFIPEADATYYLQETKAPDGYNLLESTIPVTLSLNNSYTPKPDGQATTTKPTGNVIYDWTQIATLSLGQYYTRIVDAAGNHIGHIEADSETAKVYYQIMNNPGVSLPQTGGSGTIPFHLLGGLLLVGAGIQLIRRLKAMPLNQLFD